jgi:hypothetical protein
LTTSPSGWTQNDNGTWSPPPFADPQNWKDVPENIQRTIIKDGRLDVYDANGVLRARIGKDGTDYDIKVFTVSGTATSLSTLAFSTNSATVGENGDRAAGAGWGDLAAGPVGPAVTVTISSSGRAWVLYGSYTNPIINNTNQSCVAYNGFQLSGANTRAPVDAEACIASMSYLSVSGTLSWAGNVSRAVLLTGLNPGSTTFTMKYKAEFFKGWFAQRWILVVPQ